jgi:hypothetical protein
VNRFTFATLNYKKFGYDESTATHDLEPLATLLEPAADADVLVLCECAGCESDGARLLLHVQGMVKALWGEPAQAFVSHEERGPYPKITLVRLSRIEPLQHYADPRERDVPKSKAGQLRCLFDGVWRPVTLEPVHLNPFDGDARLAWARSKGNGTAPGQLHIKLGDFNAIWPGHPELDWSGRLDYHSHHKTLETPHGRVSDLRAMSELRRQGWSWAAELAGGWTPTVNAHGPDSVCPTVDGFLVSSTLTPALLPESYQVIEPPPDTFQADGQPATDHRLVKVSLDLNAPPRDE